VVNVAIDVYEIGKLKVKIEYALRMSIECPPIAVMKVRINSLEL